MQLETRLLSVKVKDSEAGPQQLMRPSEVLTSVHQAEEQHKPAGLVHSHPSYASAGSLK
jgi:proteasome lid subunit RPN8/RPN11